VHLLEKVFLIGLQGVVMHWTLTSAQTGAYSWVQSFVAGVLGVLLFRLSLSLCAVGVQALS